MMMLNHALPPLLAEADIGQIVFVVIFLLVGFIQWVIKVIKEKVATAERNRHVPTQAEIDARRATWEQQTRPVTPDPRSESTNRPTPETHGRGAMGDLLGELRKVVEMAERPATPPPLPPTAPVRPSPAAAPAYVASTRIHVPEPASPYLLRDSEAALPGVTGGSSLASQRRRPHPLTALLHTPDGYRQAFVLREVLGPPRALNEYRGPED